MKTVKQLEKRMLHLDKMYHRHWAKEVGAINQFLQHNGGIDPPDWLEKISDKRAMDAAWLYDRIQNKICTTHHSDYRKSLTKKIRKALGYTI